MILKASAATVYSKEPLFVSYKEAFVISLKELIDCKRLSIKTAIDWLIFKWLQVVDIAVFDFLLNFESFHHLIQVNSTLPQQVSSFLILCPTLQ